VCETVVRSQILVSNFLTILPHFSGEVRGVVPVTVGKLADHLSGVILLANGCFCCESCTVGEQGQVCFVYDNEHLVFVSLFYLT